jgi:carbon-monoxide dehydrogenase small subunit
LKQEIRLTVNGKTHKLEVNLHKSLAEVLRNELKLTGVKYGCGTGECGACTVLVDGKPRLSCLTLAVSIDGKEITTIEGLPEDGKLHPLQEAFIKHGAIQCGYCTPGMILCAKALLDENPRPTEEDVKQYLRGNLCRCTGYAQVVEAVLAAAEEIRG